LNIAFLSLTAPLLCFFIHFCGCSSPNTAKIGSFEVHVIPPLEFWPSVLGGGFLAVGLWTYRSDLASRSSHHRLIFAALGPVFVAASLAAFGGEHFADAKDLARLVPKWMPDRVFIAYFVGVAHVAAALSIVAKKYIRWSAICLAIMFGLFVVLLHLRGVTLQPANRLFWMISLRDSTFGIGALALYAYEVRERSPQRARTLATIARFWSAVAVIVFGLHHFVHPEFSPGVPDSRPTPAWVPAPHAFAYLVGIILTLLGIATLFKKSAKLATTCAGAVMTFLAIALFGPDLFLANDVSQYIMGINFVFDTLLFAGTLLVIARAVPSSTGRPNLSLATGHSAVFGQ